MLTCVWALVDFVRTVSAPSHGIRLYNLIIKTKQTCMARLLSVVVQSYNGRQRDDRFRPRHVFSRQLWLISEDSHPSAQFERGTRRVHDHDRRVRLGHAGISLQSSAQLHRKRQLERRQQMFQLRRLDAGAGTPQWHGAVHGRMGLQQGDVHLDHRD